MASLSVSTSFLLIGLFDRLFLALWWVNLELRTHSDGFGAGAAICASLRAGSMPCGLIDILRLAQPFLDNEIQTNMEAFPT
jgi:hypothetical protein